MERKAVESNKKKPVITQDKKQVKDAKKEKETKPKKAVKKEEDEEEFVSKRKQKEEKRKKRTEDDDFLDKFYSKLNPTSQIDQEDTKPKQQRQDKAAQKKEPKQQEEKVEHLENLEEDVTADIIERDVTADIIEEERVTVDASKLLLTSFMIVGSIYSLIFALAGSKRLINFVGFYAYALSPIFSLLLALVGGVPSRSRVKAGNAPDQFEIQSYGTIALAFVFFVAVFSLAKVIGPYFMVTKTVKTFKPKVFEEEETPEEAKPSSMRKVREIQRKVETEVDEDTASVESDELSE